MDDPTLSRSTDVTQPLVLCIHDLEDGSVSKDSVRRHPRTRLDPRLNLPRPNGRAARIKPSLTNVQKGWSTDRELHVQPGSRVPGGGPSNGC